MDPYIGIVVFELEAGPMIFISSMQIPRKKHMRA